MKALDTKTEGYKILVQLIDKCGKEVARFTSHTEPSLELLKKSLDQEQEFDSLRVSIFKKVV